jgi:fructose-1-phosphate kinase PfkB-like protein
LATPTIQPVSAIGSGDSFAAGLAFGIVRGQSVLDAARLGCACGVSNALNIGSGRIDPTYVRQLVAEIHPR